MHDHATQAPAAQVCIDAHAAVVYPRPSALQVRVLLPSQVRVPGVHTQLEHMFVLGSQVLIEGQAVVAPWCSPSSSQRRIALPPTQLIAPGLQTRSTQSPALQLCPSAHAIEVYPRPSASQTSRRVKLPAGQRAEPGAQTRSRHAPSRQLWLSAQGVGA